MAATWVFVAVFFVDMSILSLTPGVLAFDTYP